MATSSCLCNEADGNKYCVQHGGRAPSARMARAVALAAKTQDAYSADAYTSWVSVASLLLSRGYSESEAEAIMRSKWTRWAGDRFGRNSNLPARALAEYIDGFKPEDVKTDVAALVRGTFDV